MTSREQEIASGMPAQLDHLPRLNGFRLRGLEMTRLETFIDAAFAFSITMLVIAAERVPDNITELLGAFRNVPSFIASIAVLGIFWRGHWLWSRRYGLEDGVSIFISWAMIVTILIYIYPLKAVFGGMFYLLSDHQLGQPIRIASAAQARALFAVFAAGFTAIAFEVWLLNFRAWRLREPLRLNERERVLALSEITGWSIPVMIGLVSLALALLLPVGSITFSGWAYLSLAFLVPLHAAYRRRRLRRLPASIQAP